MVEDAAHKRGWQIFEVVAGVPFLLALGLQRAVPLSFPRGSTRLVFILAGALLILAGVALVARARGAFARSGQPTDPGRPTSALMTEGVFSFSRNPLYLGGLVFLAGVGLAFNLPWVLILLLPTIAACQVVLIAPEEKYLAEKFGRKYELYTQVVHRWLGRKRRWK